jgi:serine/threonine protein kinase
MAANFKSLNITALHFRYPRFWRDFNRSSEKQMLVRSSKIKGATTRIYWYTNLESDEFSIKFHDLFSQNQCKTIKWEKKIRVFRMPLHFGPTIKSVYVKQHNAVSIRHRLGSLFCKSSALRSLCGAATLLQEGYATARPVTAVEYRRWGVLTKSFYVSEEIAGAKTITDYWREGLVARKDSEGRVKRRRFLTKLACLFKSLHEKGIYHNDLKAANILVLDKGPVSEEALNLIDLQGVRRCYYVSRRRRIKNLAQINRTLGNYLTPKEKLTFLRTYIGDGIFARRKRRRLIRSILQETSCQLIREKLRHSPPESHASLEIVSVTHGLGNNECGYSSAL